MLINLCAEASKARITEQRAVLFVERCSSHANPIQPSPTHCSTALEPTCWIFVLAPPSSISIRSIFPSKGNGT